MSADLIAGLRTYAANEAAQGFEHNAWFLREAASALEVAEARIASVRAESVEEWQDGPVPADALFIDVRHEWTYRFLAYKASSQQRKKGIKGRWQRATEYGWENCAAPDGMQWRLNSRLPFPPAPKQEGA